MVRDEAELQIGEANVTESIDDKEDVVDACSVTKGGNQHDSWILDSSCDLHMYHNRDSFDTYESCDGEFIFMGNNAE